MIVTEFFRMVNIMGREDNFWVINSVDIGRNKYKRCINIFRQNIANLSSKSSRFSDILTNILASEGLYNMVYLTCVKVNQYWCRGEENTVFSELEIQSHLYNTKLPVWVREKLLSLTTAIGSNRKLSTWDLQFCRQIEWSLLQRFCLNAPQ